MVFKFSLNCIRRQIFAVILSIVAGTLVANADEVLTAPGQETPKVIEILQKVIAGAMKHDALTQNFKAVGRTRSVSIPWPDGPDQKANNKQEWSRFQLVHHGNLRRYEQEYRPSPEVEMTKAYRLMNADGFYKLDGKVMYISPHTEDDEDSWANLDGSMLVMSEVFDGQRYAPVVTTCRSLIAQLEGKVKDNAWHPDLRLLRCSTTGSLITVEMIEGNAVPEEKRGYTFSFTVNSAQGFRVIAAERHAGGEGRGLDYSDSTMLKIVEHGDGIFFPMHGVQMIRSRGSVDVNSNNGSISKREFIIDKLTIGDFEFDKALFEASSLPIPDSTYVEDRRFSPPREYTWPIRK